MQTDSSKLNPVFITGTPRSGTTLLYRTLLKHSSFKPGALCLEETNVFTRDFLALKSSERPEALFNYMLEDESAYQRYLDSIRFEQLWQKICRKLKVPSLFTDETARWQFLKNPSVARKYFSEARKARQCKRIVEKTPRHLLYTPRIFKVFPGSKIIVTTRHPVDVYSSYKKRKQRDPQSSWLNISIPEFVNRYQRMTDHSSELFEQKRALCVKYEDFVKDPHTGFTQICRYIGEPFEEEILAKAEPELSDYKADPYLSRPITKKTKDWSDYMEPAEAQLIEEKLKQQMLKFGYSSRLTGTAQ